MIEHYRAIGLLIIASYPATLGALIYSGNNTLSQILILTGIFIGLVANSPRPFLTSFCVMPHIAAVTITHTAYYSDLKAGAMAVITLGSFSLAYIATDFILKRTS